MRGRNRSVPWPRTTIAIAIAASLWALAIQAAEPLVYRRVLVPADALDSQIRDLLPLKRDEFERRLALLQRDESQSRHATVRVEQAVFQARLDGNRLVGSGSLDVVAKG